jgi:hypothetical protein
MVVQQNLKATGLLTSFGKDNFGKLVGKEGEGSLIKTTSEGLKFSFKSGSKEVRTSSIQNISVVGNTLYGESVNGRSFSMLLNGSTGLWDVPNGEKCLSFHRGWFINSGKIGKDGAEVDVEITVAPDGNIGHILLTAGKTYIVKPLFYQYSTKELLAEDGEKHGYTVLDIRTVNGSVYTVAF